MQLQVASFSEFAEASFFVLYDFHGKIGTWQSHKFRNRKYVLLKHLMVKPMLNNIAGLFQI